MRRLSRIGARAIVGATQSGNTEAIMINIEHRDNLVAVTVFGEFTLADYKEFGAGQIQDPVLWRLDLLFDLREMAGFTLDVAWEEIKFSRQHAHDFRRIAVVTDDQWLTWSAWVSQLFVTAEVQVFDDENEARGWLQSAGASSAAGVESVPPETGS